MKPTPEQITAAIPPVTTDRLGAAFSLLEQGQPGDWKTPEWSRKFRSRLQLHLRVDSVEATVLAARVACLLTLLGTKGSELEAAGHVVTGGGQVALSTALVTAAGQAPVTPTGFADGWIAHRLREMASTSS